MRRIRSKLKPRHLAVLAGTFLVVVFLLLATALLFLLPSKRRDNEDPARRAEMIQVSRVWGRLASFPSSAENFSIRTEGSMFTRTFKGSFDAAPDVVDEWLANSPGVEEGQTEFGNDGSRTHILKTGEGAAYGEIRISPDGSHVTFRVSWS